MQAIKTRRNIKILKQHEYFEKAVLYDRKSDPEAKREIDPKMGKTDPDLKTRDSSRLVGKIDNITVLQSLSFLAILH